MGGHHTGPLFHGQEVPFPTLDAPHRPTYHPPMKTIVECPNAPRPVGPYSQAVVANGFVFVAGQVSIDPATQKPVFDSVASQTRRVLQNLRSILEAAGSGLDRVVKTTVYLRDLNDFRTVNEVYATFFTTSPPARATIQAAALPLGLDVEIDCVALT